jgi:hypothetical protein
VASREPCLGPLRHKGPKRYGGPRPANQRKHERDQQRRERVARQVTQERLAELADLNIRKLQEIEAGQTNILVTTTVRLHRALGCSWGALMPD